MCLKLIKYALEFQMTYYLSKYECGTVLKKGYVRSRPA